MCNWISTAKASVSLPQMVEIYIVNMWVELHVLWGKKEISKIQRASTKMSGSKLWYAMVSFKTMEGKVHIIDYYSILDHMVVSRGVDWWTARILCLSSPQTSGIEWGCGLRSSWSVETWQLGCWSHWKNYCYGLFDAGKYGDGPFNRMVYKSIPWNRWPSDARSLVGPVCSHRYESHAVLRTGLPRSISHCRADLP